MKLRPVTNIHRRNITTSKKIDDDVISKICNAIIIFAIFGQFEAIRMPDPEGIFCKTYVFINSNLLSHNKRIINRIKDP